MIEYKTILIDPPWKLCSGGSKGLAVHTHYPVQTIQEIKDTVSNWIQENPVASEAHLYLWTVNSYSAGYSRGILDALDLCDHIGFRPITNLVWAKPQSNPTPYGQRATEICIFATRHRKGNHKEIMYKGTSNQKSVVSPGLSSSVDWFISDRRDHSRKPDSFYDYIESRSQGPYLELYSRTGKEGWTGIGNQSGKWKL